MEDAVVPCFMVAGQEGAVDGMDNLTCVCRLHTQNVPRTVIWLL